VRQLQDDAQARWEKARRGVEGRAFAVRLLFVVPLLALAIWQFRRFRGTDQWPFVWGFLLFGLFAFFFELVPYMPSFGAYIRYGVGALLTFLGGRALIRWLNAYLLRKQAEQAAPQQERQSQIRYETALQTLGRNQCPSCERSLSRSDGQLPNFCMHCGLQIHRDCPRCNRLLVGQILQPLHRRRDPLVFQCFGFRDVKTQDHGKWPLDRRVETIGFFVLPV
jgi:hypothetical protein